MELTKDQRTSAMESIKSYLLEEFDEEAGDLAAGLFLDYILEAIGPYVYNQALADSRKWFRTKIEGLEIDYTLLAKDPPSR